MAARRSPSPKAKSKARGAAALTHVDRRGQARMVGVGDKPDTMRSARVGAMVRLQPATVAAVRANALQKGDVLATARLAGVMAAKRTSELVPLCHPLRLTHVEIELAVTVDGITIESHVTAVDRTGVEMEAMTGAMVAALTIYDMVKAVDRGAVIERVELLEKHGGKTGRWARRARR